LQQQQQKALWQKKEKKDAKRLFDAGRLLLPLSYLGLVML
jgi:hypothetical protein